MLKRLYASLPRPACPRRLFLLLSSLSIAALLAVASCGQAEPHQSPAKATRPYGMADVAANQDVKMPSFVNASVSEGYLYALSHPDQLQYMPCYCGCGMTAGHKNNLDCYIGGVDDKGVAVLDQHASFCDVCLEITQDVKTLSEQGKSLRDIRTIVDQKHGEKGPGTETPLPPL